MEGNSAVVEAEAAVDASVAAFAAVLEAAALLVILALGLMPGLMMIRCSGLLMGRWMFWPGWPGPRRSWRH